MRHQGARCPQRVLLLVATGAGAGIQVRIIRTQATVAPTLASCGFSRGMS
jgi:hypothetical protein